MGLLFLSLFALAEVALVVLTITTWREKANFLRTRVLVIAVELLLLVLIVILPTTYMKWRFVGAFAMLCTRFALAGISFLVKGKRVQGHMRKTTRVVCCVLAVLLMVFSLVPSFVFANYNGLEVTGEFEILECSAILMNLDRIDTFENDGSSREVPVHFYYPDAEGTFPLIVFSHGAFGYYQSNYSTYAELASNGYVVAALDHPHHAFFTKDSDGNMIIADTQFFAAAMNFGNPDFMSEREALTISQAWMSLRVADENFVLDTIKKAKQNGNLTNTWITDTESEILTVLSITNTSKIGLIGHSMGGATAVALGRERTDIDAVIDLDGTMLSEIVNVHNGVGQYVSVSYDVPLLDFRKSSDYNEMEETLNEGISANNYACGFALVNDYVIANAKGGMTVVFKNAGHMDFTDLPLFSPFLGALLGAGDVDHSAFMRTVNSIVLNWFDYYLKGEGSLNIQTEY